MTNTQIPSFVFNTSSSNSFEALIHSTSPLLDLPKNKHLVANFGENCVFQLSFLPPAGSQDPLILPTFSNLGFHCIPHCGVYGENYMLCHLLVEWELPTDWSTLQRQVPASLWSHLHSIRTRRQTQMKVQFFVLGHTAPILQECQKFMCSNWNEVNMVYHTWLYPTTSFTPEVTEIEQVEMGIFEARGIRPVHQDLKDAGISFDSLSLRTVSLHNACFSPENAQFQLIETPEIEFASFWALAYHEPSQRAVITFHILPRHNEAEVKLRNVLTSAHTVRNFLQGLHSIDSHIALRLTKIILALDQSAKISHSSS